MDVMNVEQAKIAEEAGASAVMALGKLLGSRDPIKADIDRANPRQHQTRWWCRSNGAPYLTYIRRARADSQSDPGMIRQIMEAVSIPVMAKVRIGHMVEAQILQSVGVDYIDVSYEPWPSLGTS
jgi:pyridoxal 5'-phosphate synthase pdxS subunit